MNSLVNIKPYLLLINPQLKTPFLFINYSHTQKLGEHRRPPFNAMEASIIKTIGSTDAIACICFALIYMSICVSHRRSCISITAACLVTDFAQWMLILLSQHNWWRNPTVLVLTQAPAFSHSLMASHVDTMAKKHNFFSLTSVSYLQAPAHDLNRILAYVRTTNKYLFLHTTLYSHTRIQTHSFTHVLAHTNLGWLPSCASCFFHQHVFTGRGPLCLHYREAINRKASPGVLKLLFGGIPHEERALIIVWFSL